MPEPDVLTISELAALLRVSLKTAYTLAQNGEVPGFRGRRPVALPAQGYRGAARRPDPAVLAGQIGGTMSTMEAR